MCRQSISVRLDTWVPGYINPCKDIVLVGSEYHWVRFSGRGTHFMVLLHTLNNNPFIQIFTQVNRTTPCSWDYLFKRKIKRDVLSNMQEEALKCLEDWCLLDNVFKLETMSYASL